jgi:hypothetical protein
MASGSYAYYNTFLGVACADYAAQANMYAVLFTDNGGTLHLQNYDTSSPVTLSNEYMLASGVSVANLSDRTTWAQAYCPYHPEDGNLGDRVYVHGAMNVASLGGSVKLALSTDGGISFANIGDSSWGSSWVGAMFSPNTNTIYAVVNGGAAAGLWRTEDAGTTWTKLAATSFSVDSDNLTVDGDGNFILCNRAGAAYGVALCPPPYTAFVDITDNLPSNAKTGIVAIS